jgi:hypothetical protein
MSNIIVSVNASIRQPLEINWRVSIFVLLTCNNSHGQSTGLHAVKSSSTQGSKRYNQSKRDGLVLVPPNIIVVPGGQK